MRFVGSLEKISANYHKFLEPTQHLTFTSKERHYDQIPQAMKEREIKIISNTRTLTLGPF